MRPALLILAVAAWLAGCTQHGTTARGIVDGQHPGNSTGAGATFTGPANSGAASTQTAQRRIGFYAPSAAPQPPPVPAPGDVAPVLPPSAALGDFTRGPARFTLPDASPPPAWIDEKTETTFGQHQDAAGIVKMAVAMNDWGRARWLGVVCLFFAYSGLLLAVGNPDGYPVICWQIGAVGVFLVVFDPSPWWLCLLILPAGFYILQKFGLWKMPGV